MHKSRVVNNTIMLYLMSIAKLIFPLLTLPYLTRVLTEEAYGLVSYVKSCMTYLQLIVDFGFLLSSVKDIVNANGDNKKIGEIVGNTIGAKLMLVVVSTLVMGVMVVTIPILRINISYFILSFITVATTVFLADFFFRGIEKMHYITMIYVSTKAVSTILTFVFVKNDGNILWIPILDILANLLSIGITWVIIHQLQIIIHISSFRVCWRMIKESFIYFASSVATTAFSALNTMLIGIYLTDLKQVAYWGLCLNIIASIQGLYAPVCNSVYPHMIREKNLKFIHKVLAIFMPIVTVGCIFSFFFSKTAMLIVGGEKYVPAYTLFRWMIPILFFSFPAQLYGWPTLGGIGKTKQTTLSTIAAAIAQVVGLVVLAVTNYFTLTALAILRWSTEALMMCIRIYFTYQNRDSFKR